MVSAFVHNTEIPTRIAITNAVITGIRGGIDKTKAVFGMSANALIELGTRKNGIKTYPAIAEKIEAPTADI